MRGLVARWKEAVRATALPIAKRIAEAERTDASDDAGLGRLESVGNSIAGSPALGRATAATADKIQRKSKTEFQRLGIKLREAEPALGDKISKWRVENVKLVGDLFARERGMLAEVLREGEGRRYETLVGEIENRLSVAQSRAELIARDQVLKLNGQITRERQQAAGIDEYIWTASGDERVREMHADLDGERFSWDDPPVTNEDGDRNHPGEDYQCRCTAYPVLPELEGEEPQPEETPEPEPPEEAEPAIPEAVEAPELEHGIEGAIVAKATELAEAIAGSSGRVRDIVREHLDEALVGATSKDVALARKGAATFTAGAMPGGANAYHDWSGEVVVAPRVKEGAQRAVARLAAGEYDAKFAKLDPYAPGFSSYQRGRFARFFDDIDNLRTVVHEEVHGFSRTTPYSYGGVGRILEEVGTELTARDVVFGLNENLAANEYLRLSLGSYVREIDAVTGVLQKHTGLDEAKAHALIRKAHREQVCAPKPEFKSTREHLDAFMRGLDLPADKAKLVESDLLKLGGSDGGIGLPTR